MLKVTDDFDVLITGGAGDLLVQYGYLTECIYQSFTKNDVSDSADVLSQMLKAFLAGVEKAQKEAGNEEGNQ